MRRTTMSLAVLGLLLPGFAHSASAEVNASAAMLDAVTLCAQPNNPYINGIKRLHGNMFNAIEVKQVDADTTMISASVIYHFGNVEIVKGAIRVTLSYPPHQARTLPNCSLEVRRASGQQ